MFAVFNLTYTELSQAGKCLNQDGLWIENDWEKVGKKAKSWEGVGGESLVFSLFFFASRCTGSWLPI